MTTYLFAGGGTAGHVNPLLATADRLRELEPEATILVLGTAEGLEARLVPERGHELLTIPRVPFPRRPNRAALGFPAALRAALARTEELIREHGVDVVIGVGGYAAAPAYLAARRVGVPIVVHEANARPGMANRLGAAFTRFVGVTFEGTRLRHGRVVGLPLRREVETLDRAAARREALELWGLDPAKPVLLVTGGSTGARRINETVSVSASEILGCGWQILHITGSRSPVEDPHLDGYHLLEYCDRMELALAVAELAVSRSGAATVSELAVVGVPAVFIPYPVGNGEQAWNAREAVSASGAIVTADANFTPAWVRRELVPLLLDRARVARLAAGMASTGVRDGADRMVALIREALSAASTNVSS